MLPQIKIGKHKLIHAIKEYRICLTYAINAFNAYIPEPMTQALHLCCHRYQQRRLGCYFIILLLALQGKNKLLPSRHCLATSLKDGGLFE